MTDETIVIIVGFVVFLVSDYFLFKLEHRELEKQHKRHKEEIASLFDDFRGWLYNDIVNYFEGLK